MRELEPCAESPLRAGEYLTLSSDFPEFCEESYLSGDSLYMDCTLGKPGFLTRHDGAQCRLLQPSGCPSINGSPVPRVSPETCRTVQRRSWTCPHGIPRNEFNTCYVMPASQEDELRACTGIRAQFVVVDCAPLRGLRCCHESR